MGWRDGLDGIKEMTTRRHAKKGKKALQEEFLSAYESMGNISGAARLVGMTRATHYLWMSSDPTYPERFESSDEIAIDRLEQEARRRAIVGVEDPVFHGGKIVGATKRYSDTLLIFLLKGARPEKYRERQDVSVKVEDVRPLVIDTIHAGEIEATRNEDVTH